MRTRDVHAIAASIVLFVGTSLAAQTPPEPPPPGGLTLASAARARRTVEAALTAMGGVDAIRRIATVTRTLSSVRTDEGQGARPGSYQRQFDGIGANPPVVNRSTTTSFRDLKAQRSAEHLQYDIYGGQRVSRRVVLGATEGFNAYFDYVANSLRVLPPAGLQRAKAAAFRRYPESLLQTAWERPEFLRWLGTARWEGRPHDAVALTDADGTQLTLFFDATTHLLSKTESLADDGVLGDIVVETAYADYRRVGEVLLPYRIVDRRGGVVLDDGRVSSIVLDAPASDTLFVRPPGVDEVDFGKPFPNLQKLGDNVYAILGGYNTIFVELDQYVVVLEAGGSSREAETVIAKIKETAPRKPIRYLIATHWNYDHLAGVRPYVAEGTTIIAPASAWTVIERAVAAPRPLHPDALSRNPRTPLLETLGAKQRTFTDGVRSVTVYDISPSPHADEMYVAYLPKERILFEADLLDIVVPGRVGTGGDDTADLAAKIQQLGLSVERIVPVHGQIGTMEDLRQALARRAVTRGATRLIRAPARVTTASLAPLRGDEIRRSGFDDTYDAVRHLRPLFFVSRGPTSILNAPRDDIVVVINDQVQGGIEELRSLPAVGVILVRHLTAAEVYHRFGRAAPSGGIEIRTAPCRAGCQ